MWFIVLMSAVVNCKADELGVMIGIQHGPESVVAVAGSNVTFRCRTTTTSAITWSCQCPKTREIFSGVKVSPSLQHKMTATFINETGEGVLTITSVNANDSGEYACSTTHYSDKATAQLTVLDSKPQCEGGFYVDGTSRRFMVSCNVSFRGNIVPSFQCQPETPEQYIVENKSTNIVFFRKTFPASPNIIGKYVTCRMHFNNSELMSNVTWTSGAIMLTYGPASLIIEPQNKTLFERGDVLTCHADGNPTPSYRWIDVTTGQTNTNGENYTIDECGPETRVRHLLCIANNYISEMSLNYTVSLTPCDVVVSDTDPPSLVVTLGCVSMFLLLACPVLACAIRRKKLAVSSSDTQNRPDLIEQIVTQEEMPVAPAQTTATDDPHSQYVELKVNANKSHQFTERTERQRVPAPYDDVDHTRSAIRTSQ